MNYNSIEFKFGYLLGAVGTNSDWDFDIFIGECNEYIDGINLSIDMLIRLMEQFCGDVDIIKNTEIVVVGSDWDMPIGVVYFDKEKRKIIQTELCNDKEDDEEDDEELVSDNDE